MHADLRSRLRTDKPLLCPGVYDALTAALAVEAGFEALYLSGASVAYAALGRPDIGLVTLTEVADALGRITERVSLPVIVDADTGFGNAINVERTIRVFERAGAAAVQIEDQVFPKRCGHLRGKALISPTEMVGKIRAALDLRNQALIVARTDAIAVEGYDRALDRAELYVAAGADVLFVEAPETPEQMEDLCARFAGRVPLLANMVEGGRSPMRSVAELGAMGYRIVIFPGGTARALVWAMRAYFSSLRDAGSTLPFRDRMINFDELQRILGTEDALARGLRYEER